MFSVRLEVRVYEVDAQLHLNGGHYIGYADHARFTCAGPPGSRWRTCWPAGSGR